MCAPSDDWTCLGLSLHSLTIVTGFVSDDPCLKRILHFSEFLYLRPVRLRRKNALIHEMVAELVIEDLVNKEVLLLKVLSRTRSYCGTVVHQ